MELPCSDMENLYLVNIWNMHYFSVRFFSRRLFTMFNYVTNSECTNTKPVKSPRHFMTFFFTDVVKFVTAEMIFLASSTWCLEDNSILQKRRIMLGFIVFHIHWTRIWFARPSLGFVKLFIIRFLDCVDLKNKRIRFLHGRMTGSYEALQF